MIPVSGEALVTTYLNFMAFFMVFGLCIISRRLSFHKALSDRIFMDMCISLMVYAVTNSLSFVMIDQEVESLNFWAVFFRGLSMVAVLVLNFQWMIYVDFMIYGSRDILFRRYFKMSIPVLVITALLIINLFTGIVYEASGDGTYVDKPLFYVIVVINLVYFVYSLMVAVVYRIKVRPLHFFHVRPVIIPFTVGSLITIFTPYCAGPIGYAIGLTFTYITLAEKWRYDDEETGFYNKYYVTEIMNRVEDGIVKYRTAILVNTKDSEKGAIRILQEAIPKEGEIVRMDNGRFLVLFEEGNKKLAKWITNLMQTRAANEEKSGHQEINIEIDSLVKMKDEDALSFIKKAISLGRGETDKQVV